jgi:hypothetical protein
MRGSKIPFIFYLFPTQGLILGPIALQSTQPTDDELARFRLPVLSLLLYYSQCPDPYLSILSTLFFFRPTTWASLRLLTAGHSSLSLPLVAFYRSASLLAGRHILSKPRSAHGKVEVTEQ